MTKKKNTPEIYYKQPEYYSNFKCAGGNCPFTCCAGWRINWTKEETERLISAADSCSDTLRELAGNSFAPDDESGSSFHIVLEEEDRKCPFLTEEGLCLIRTELGEEYLSSACARYPAAEKTFGNAVIRYCNMSCAGVLRTLLEDPSCMKLVTIAPGADEKAPPHGSRVELAVHPELKYREYLLDFFCGVVSNESIRTENCLVMGAVAAKRLTDHIGKKNYDHIPALVETLKHIFRDKENIDAAANVRPNHIYRLGICGKLLALCADEQTAGYFYSSGALDAEKGDTAAAALAESLAAKPYAIRNIALELLFECLVPFFRPDWTVFENYVYYAASFALVKLALTAAAMSGEDTDERMISSVSMLCRRLFQDKSIQEPVLNILKYFRCTTPAAAAALVK